MNPLTMKRGANGEQTFARSAPLYIDARVLETAVAEVQAVPAGAKFVIFGSDGDFYARPNGAAAVPGADIANGTGSELNPVIWDLTGVATIGLVAPGARVVTLSFYSDAGQ